MNSLTTRERQAIAKTATPWTPEQDVVFRRMWAAGKSIDVIGAAVGKTRNSVASRRVTLGLTPRGNAGRAIARRVAKNNNPTGWNALKRDPPKPMLPKTGNRHTPSLPPVRHVAAPVPIMELKRAQCRYIGERPDLLTINTAIYCGAPTDGGSWCPEHKARCIVPLRR